MIENENPDKAFWNLRATLAMAGAAVWRSDAGDGARVYFLEHGQRLRRFPSLDQLCVHLDRVAPVLNISARALGA